MPAKWHITTQTKAPVPKVLEYFTHPENLPKVHPDFVKAVTIKGREDDTVSFEQQMESDAPKNRFSKQDDDKSRGKQDRDQHS